MQVTIHSVAMPIVLLHVCLKVLRLENNNFSGSISEALFRRPQWCRFLLHLSITSFKPFCSDKDQLSTFLISRQPIVLRDSLAV
jgi:hypothetical protein